MQRLVAEQPLLLGEAPKRRRLGLGEPALLPLQPVESGGCLQRGLLPLADGPEAVFEACQLLEGQFRFRLAALLGKLVAGLLQALAGLFGQTGRLLGIALLSGLVGLAHLLGGGLGLFAGLLGRQLRQFGGRPFGLLADLLL